MATNHFALYCAVSNDKKYYKIGMTQQTKRAREQKNFAIIKYADFYNTNRDRELLFAMEDKIRTYMSQYYQRDNSTMDYFHIENYDIAEFSDRFVCGIMDIIKLIKTKQPLVECYIEDYIDEVEKRIASNNYMEGLTLTEYLEKYF